ncbi:transglutaminase family protein [Demequina aurantiaca]|uniref:transglutaminase family protein n=1 Tax=Demequina aurantiaca TaxID=676200 RepID=UPI0007865A82|nr:transglutaminaseTgpA domain-containing protein [Demequina aurantiaca]
MSRRPKNSRASRANRPSWLVTILIAVAALLGLGGLSVMIHYDTWLRTVVVTVLAVAAVVAFARTRTASRWVPTAIGAVAAFMFMIWDFAAREDGSHHTFPTIGALRDLGAALGQGIHHAEVSTIPVTATPGFAAIIAGSVLALFLVSEYLTVSWGLTATAGILLLLAWLPAAILQHQVSITLLVAAIGCWVAAMVLTRAPTGRGRPNTLTGAAVTAGAVVAIAALVAPLGVGAPGWGMIPRFEAPGGLDGTTRLNLALDLRSSLTTKSGTAVMVYATSGSRPEALRLYTLTDFDGNSWERDEPIDESVPATDGVLWPTAVDDWSGRNRERLDIQVRSLSESNLPLPTAPRTVDVGPGWSYVPSRDEVTSSDKTTNGLTYSVVTDLDYHDKDSLIEEQGQIDEGADEGLDPRYLEVAPDIDLDRVHTVAQNVTDRADTRYAQALALQQYLRSPLDFTYDTTVSPTGDDSVSEFLDARSGYCVQFATTMVVLARSLGIPARLAVGFLGGTVTEDETYVVRGSDAHAWPELYFADQGWVRFEPTPAIQTGTPPIYADPTQGINEPVINLPEGRAPENPGDISNPDLGVDPGSSVDTTAAPVTSWWAVAGLIVVALAVAAALWWRHRVRPVHALTEPERAWRILSDRLAPRIGWPDTLTPLEAPTHIDEGLRPLRTRLSDDAQAALARVCGAVSDARYGFTGDATGTDHADRSLGTDARLVATEVEQAIKGKPVSK